MAEDVLEKINLPLKKDTFLLASQGPDPLFYHRSLPLQKKSIIPRIGNSMHELHTDGFLYNMIDFVKKNPDNELKSFLYGFICHHVLDYTAHPYVFFMTGNYSKEVLETKKYRGLHLEMERGIDRYYIETRLKMKAEKFKPFDYFLKTKVSERVEEMIDASSFEFFEIEQLGKLYNEAVIDMYKTFKFIAYDPLGIKKKIYKVLDKYFNTENSLVYEHVSYYQTKDYHQYLNLEQEEHLHPCDKTLKSTDSFIDLVEKAKEEATYIINELELFFQDKREDYFNLLKGFNYSTGIYWKDNQEMEYFKF
jgi:hypothetical protein